MTTPTPLDGGGPAAGGSGKITRGAVLAAALEIIDRDGAEALSMRRLDILLTGLTATVTPPGRGFPPGSPGRRRSIVPSLSDRGGRA